MDMREVSKAEKRLTGVVHKLDLVHSHTFSKLAGANIFLKFEHMQKTGSFKVRGAYNKLAKLTEEGKPKKVVAASAGNHAQGVAYAARALGIEASIVMPRSTPLAKVLATQNYGAEVVLFGDCYDDACKKAREICEECGAVFIHPFDDEDVIAGQATIGLEILKDLSAVDAIVLPAGGGGLLAGVAFAVKSINPDVKIIGVQAEKADAIARSFKERKKVCLDSIYTIADGIAVKNPGDRTLELIYDYVDQMVTVSDDEIAATIIQLIERTKQIVEPAGAVSLAAALNKKLDLKGKNVVCVLSGGNIDMGFISKIIEKGLISRGRQMKVSVLMPDVPGSLAKFSAIMGETNANIISVLYDRLSTELHLNETIIHVTCEVGGFEHGKRLIAQLECNGYKVYSNSGEKK